MGLVGFWQEGVKGRSGRSFKEVSGNKEIKERGGFAC